MITITLITSITSITSISFPPDSVTVAESENVLPPGRLQLEDDGVVAVTVVSKMDIIIG